MTKESERDNWFSAKMLSLIGTAATLFLGLIISLIMWGSSVNSDIALIKSNAAMQDKRIDSQELQYKEASKELKLDLKEIKDSLMTIMIRLGIDDRAKISKK